MILLELLPPSSPPAASHLNCELRISVGTAGPQPRAPDLSGHCRTSNAGPQPRAPELSGRCRTSARRQRERQIECFRMSE